MNATIVVGFALLALSLAALIRAVVKVSAGPVLVGIATGACGLVVTLIGVVQVLDDAAHSCSDKGGVIVRGYCIERSAVINLN